MHFERDVSGCFARIVVIEAGVPGDKTAVGT